MGRGERVRFGLSAGKVVLDLVMSLIGLGMVVGATQAAFTVESVAMTAVAALLALVVGVPLAVALKNVWGPRLARLRFRSEDQAEVPR